MKNIEFTGVENDLLIPKGQMAFYFEFWLGSHGISLHTILKIFLELVYSLRSTKVCKI